MIICRPCCCGRLRCSSSSGSSDCLGPNECLCLSTRTSGPGNWSCWGCTGCCGCCCWHFERMIPLAFYIIYLIWRHSVIYFRELSILLQKTRKSAILNSKWKIRVAQSQSADIFGDLLKFGCDFSQHFVTADHWHHLQQLCFHVLGLFYACG